VNDAAGDPGAPEWVRAADVAERTTSAADAAARAWGGSRDSLDGWIVRYVGGDFIDCDGTRADGCSSAGALGGGGTMRLLASASPTCLEATSLAHEVGHAVIGDHDHRDPRWRDSQFWRRMRLVILETLTDRDAACVYAVASASTYPGGI
jgi:hypothetical protein